MENRRSTLISLAGLLGLTLAMFGDVSSAIQATRETFTPSSRDCSAWRRASKLPAAAGRITVLRAVPLTAGRHRLRLEYASQAFEIGKWISIVTGLAFLAALSWYWRHKSS